MPENLFTFREFRRSSLFFSFLGAIALESVSVGVAQLWPAAVSGEVICSIPTILADPPIGNPPELILPKDDPIPMPEAEPTPTPDETPPAQETPPPDTLPEMMLDAAKPTPTPGPRHVPRPTGTPFPENPRRGDRPQAGIVGGAEHATPSAGRPGGAPGGIRPRTPKPPYPFQARVAKLTGSGICRVTFDAAGRVMGAVMIQSIGNTLLDNNTASYARANWSGQPNSVADVPVTYRLP